MNTDDKKEKGLADLAGCRPDPNLTDAALLKAIDEHVGRQFKAARLLRRVKLTEIAEGLGLSYQQFQKYQKGGDRMSASRMYQIASFLKLSPAFFFDGLPLTKTEPLPAFRKEHFDLVRYYERVPAKSRKELLRLIKIMSRESE